MSKSDTNVNVYFDENEIKQVDQKRKTYDWSRGRFVKNIFKIGLKHADKD